ncbi:MAG: hypothetical protein KDA42_12155 [Planctomycetales bacterium]|nr:hypothetical protein [Planctomycetales bacterium]
MDWNTTKEQLIREAKAKPGKTAVLGLLLVVAIWFWAPLVAKWLPASDGTTSPASTSTAAVAAAIVSTPQTREIVNPSQPSPTWREVAHWMSQDQMMTAAPGVDKVEPFGAAVVQPSPDDSTAVESQPAEIASKSFAESTPAELGIRLTSTIVGSQKRIAMINGRPYAEGRPFVFRAGDRAIEFQVTRIQAQQIVLSQGEKQHTLKIEKNDENVVYENL